MRALQAGGFFGALRWGQTCSPTPGRESEALRADLKNAPPTPSRRGSLAGRAQRAYEARQALPLRFPLSP